MLDSLLGAGGIVLSVLFFIVGYRQTIGARKERIRVADRDVEKILVRRIVVEGYTPTRTEVNRLLEGKARDHRVSVDEMLSEAQTLNAVYTRVFESDLIPTEQRIEILKRVDPILVEVVTKPSAEYNSERGPASWTRALSSQVLAALSVAAVAAGTGASLVPELLNNIERSTRGLLLPALMTAGASLVVVGSLAIFLRFRTKQDESATRGGEMQRYATFEAHVVRMLRHALPKSARVETGSEDADLVLTYGDRKILVDVKTWTRPVPAAVVRKVRSRLASAAKRHGTDEAIVVTYEPPDLSELEGEDSEGSVKFMSLRAFQNYVIHLGMRRDK